MKLDKNGILKIREAEKDSETATILFAGDCCPRANGETLILQGEADNILEPMQDIFAGADLSLIQFETPLTTDDTPAVKSGPNLKCDPDTIDFLNAWGGDVALLANNHIGDFGTKPVVETIDILNQNGFKTVGAGVDLEDSYKPLIMNVNDISVGILNFAENEFGTAAPGKPGAAPLNPCLNIMQIRALAAKVDVCIVVTHGGNEGNPIPSPRVVQMSRAFAEAGANIVVNIHTHCPQGIEVYKDSTIVYSLGNFYFPWPPDRPEADDFWTTGYLVKFQIDKKGATSVQAIPSRFEHDGSLVEPLTPAQQAGFFKYLTRISSYIENWEQLVKAHEAWAATSGYTWNLRHYSFTEEMFSEPAPCPKLMPLRNLFTCEAHNEVLRTFMRLVEEGRLEKAKADFKEIKKLQSASYMKLK